MSGSGAAPHSPADILGEAPQESGDPAVFLNSASSPSRPALWLGFLVAFVSAWCAFIIVGHFGFGIPRSLSLVGADPELQASEPIHEPFVVSNAGVFKQVSFDPALNPRLGEDFIFFIWFKVRKSPADGESLALMGKFDATQQHRPGYALSLEGAPDGVRPKIYWNDAEGQGRWHALSSIRLRRKNWYLLAIVFSKDTFLSAHVAMPGSDSEPILLGGNRVEPVVIPQSDAAMVVGATGAGRFRGQLGPFGVLRGKKLASRVKEIVTSMAAEPDSIPSEVATSTIALWASPQVDRGPNRIPIVAGVPQARDVPSVVEHRPKNNPAAKISKRGPKKLSLKKNKGKRS